MRFGFGLWGGWRSQNSGKCFLRLAGSLDNLRRGLGRLVLWFWGGCRFSRSDCSAGWGRSRIIAGIRITGVVAVAAGRTLGGWRSVGAVYLSRKVN